MLFDIPAIDCLQQSSAMEKLCRSSETAFQQLEALTSVRALYYVVTW